MLKRKNKASVLVVTMIILGLILISALSMSLVSLRERRASIGDAKSQLAFQNAQTGVEVVLYALMNNRTAPGDKQLNALSGFGCANNNDAVLTKSGDNTYIVELMKYGYNASDSSTFTKCADSASTIVSIKSIGIGTGQQRAIEAAVPTAP